MTARPAQRYCAKIWTLIPIIFVAVFLGVAALVVTAVVRQQRRWRVRPAILRALATRRGYGFIEKPGKPSELMPIRPLEKSPYLQKVELPAAVSGRTVNADFMLFDVFTQHVPKHTHDSYEDTYATFMTIKSGDKPWPHFEFSALARVDPRSMTAGLLAMASNLADAQMKERDLVHIPIPDQPGYMLYADNVESGERLRVALMELFAHRDGWWVGAMGDALTLQRRGSHSSRTMGMLIPEKELDQFIDDSLLIERSLSAAIRP